MGIQHRRWTAGGQDATQPVGYFAKGFVPRDGFELAGPFSPLSP